MQITCLATCDSADALRLAIDLARRITTPEMEFVWQVITYPGGVEHRETRAYRIGDYFSEIIIIPGTDSFSIVFHVREGVTSFWKDMLVAVLQKIGKQVSGVKTSILRS